MGRSLALELRQDKDGLWENFFLNERLKHLHYAGILANRFFWRTQYLQEIDYIEEQDGFFYLYEFKWNPRKKVRFSTTLTGNYPVRSAEVITPDNFEAFLGWSEGGAGTARAYYEADGVCEGDWEREGVDCRWRILP